MEFWGLIYDKRFARRGIFLSKAYDEYSINSPGLKKYYVNGKWILSTSYEYLNKTNLRKYISRSDSFAKVLFSSKLEILKFDYIEKGVFKKQLVIEKQAIKNNIGFDQIDIGSKTLTEILDEILWDHFRLDIELIEPHESYFITLESTPFKASKRDTFFDVYLILNIPKSILTVIFSPIIAYYLSRILIHIISNRELLTMKSLFLVFAALIVSLIIPVILIIVVYKELTNYLRIQHKVLSDKILTMPNIGS